MKKPFYAPDRRCLDCGGSGWTVAWQSADGAYRTVERCRCWRRIDPNRKPKPRRGEIRDGKALGAGE